MISRGLSLRQRLFGLILVPLVLVAILLGYWRFTVAQQTALELFDRTLLSTALAVSRDVAISGGDALLPSTRELIRDASGGEVFYHVTGPAGAYVTGYAYPPIGIVKSEPADRYLPVFSEAVYRNEAVRVLQITERISSGNLSGDTTVTVWQRISDRKAFAQDLAIRAAALMGALLTTLSFLVWFGVQLGLRPLLDLEAAIEMRSPDDLSAIKRPVPEEARGILMTLNRLFRQVEESINLHQVFISDAAHQLRNPAAAIQSMAEAARDAATEEERLNRINELVVAARSAARVTEQLLSLDRLRQEGSRKKSESFDLNLLTEETFVEVAAPILMSDIDVDFVRCNGELKVNADKLFVAEAIKNLIDNALKHGGAGLSRISVTTDRQDGMAIVSVRDDGVGLPPDQAEIAFSRFSQIEPSVGSGLGLAIAASVAKRHGGELRIDPVEKGASLTIALPLI